MYLDDLPQGLTYEAALDVWAHRIATGPAGDRAARKSYFYTKYNRARAEAVDAAYEPSRALTDAMAAIRAPQRWLVLTEDWCVDSAFALPVIARAARLNPLVTLRIIPRDANPDLMDRYLTNGARSIPKLVAFSAEGQELFRWGPRPAGAVAYRQQLVDEGLEKPVISARLAEWLEAGGWRGVEPELTTLVAASTQRVPGETGS